MGPHTAKTKRASGGKAFFVRPPRVLLAEDNVVNQKVVVLQLERTGIVPHIAANGAKALEAHRKQPYDLIFMDCQMPVLDGYATAAAIRRLESGTGARVPIVGLTANALPGDREKCIAAGMDDYLSKPVTPTGLESVLRRWVKGGESSPGPAHLQRLVHYSRLNDVFRSDETTIHRLLELFVSSTPELLARIVDAVRGHDLGHLRGALHELKGASNMVAAMPIADLAASMERKAQSEPDWGELEGLCRQMQDLFDRTAEEIARHAPRPE